MIPIPRYYFHEYLSIDFIWDSEGREKQTVIDSYKINPINATFDYFLWFLSPI